MVLHQPVDEPDVRLVHQRLELHHVGVAPVAEAPLAVEDEGHPPLMPAPKFRPVGPSTTTTPPVMYSQPWSPTPSTTADAPLFRTANRSPASPDANSSPPVAP
jgi:hypothetical protein